MLIIIILVIVLLAIVVATTVAYVNLINVHHEEVLYPLALFDNGDVPLIEPPAEIIIEGNAHECHRTLTPCTTHADCDLCREGLANCQLFDYDTVIELNDERVLIRAGESYCLALDRERARSCNPNTGVWLLAETEIGFALLCSCLRPGLVTQLNMYEDCDVPVGCAPHGHLDLTGGGGSGVAMLRCVCDEGYVSDFNAATETPFCRPRTVRDVMYDEAFFPRAPCADGQVRLDHPALNDFYRTHFRLGDICVIDPCSVDPISGRRTAGRLFYFVNADGKEAAGCNCSSREGLIGVYNWRTADTGMVRQIDGPVVNACLQPFNVHMTSLRHADYKYFWGRSDHDTTADADVVFYANRNQLSHRRYEAIFYRVLTPHPDVTEIISADTGIIKFSLAYDTTIKDILNIRMSIFIDFKITERRTTRPCFFPGAGRCIVSNPNDCIRRHANAQVWTAETFTGSWCVLSRQGNDIKIWSRATRYPAGQAPAVLRLRGFFRGSHNDREAHTIRTVTAGDIVADRQQINALTQVLDTFPNYSV
ncbi:pif-1 [Cyclophragma undans nucleopolyhedrovirus]|uniref:Pif-1 n=1 Tax=Cyclophragma undans nucleopolyhedrovirus TaxID=1906244 RepID=A0A288QZI1_9ABAC|nr:pif-1 [Cyclophragma undans nucleopolyhedrovirus]AOT85502.1 pif-1 [Cyclophragma undans nucleopolyhedrovirus]